MGRWLGRILIFGVVVGLIAAVAVPAVGWWQQRAVPRYLTATVSRGKVETVVNSTGSVKPIRTVSVGAFTSGPITEVKVNFNDKVYKETPPRLATKLAIIDPTLAKAALAHDLAALKSQEAARDSQQADLKRIQALLDQALNNEKRAKQLQHINEDYLSKTDSDQFYYTRLTYEAQVEQAKANIEQAKAAIDQAKATVENSTTNLAYTTIEAPEDGIILERKVDPGQTVAASFQTPELFVIAPEMDVHMYVYASVDEADIGLIRTAQSEKRPVKFTIDAYPGDLFQGKIYQVRNNATTTQNVVTYPVIIDAPNKDLKLMPGMTANISFQIEAKEDVLRVPAAALRYAPAPALVRPQDRHFVEGLPANPAEGAPNRSAGEKAEQARNRRRRVVWVQEGPLLRAVPVTLGLIENQFAEVVDGDLTEGQAVVTGTESAFAPR